MSVVYSWKKKANIDAWLYEPEEGKLQMGSLIGIVYHPPNFEPNQWLWEVRKVGGTIPVNEGIEETSRAAKDAVEGEVKWRTST